MIRKLLALIILSIGAAFAFVLLKTAPVAQTTAKKPAPKEVQTIAVEPANHAVSLSAYGTVIPARTLVVSPEVSARVVSHHQQLVPGGRLSQGETIVALDESEFAIALRNARTSLDEAKAAVAIEEGRQTVAQGEYEQLRKDLPEAQINRALVLREPFKKQAEAAVARAEAAVARAELDVTRSRITAPFNALVINESVETGQVANSGQPLATLVGSDSFWVQTSLPLSDLACIQLPTSETSGSRAEVRVNSTSQAEVRVGQVVRLLGEMSEQGRLARVLVEVPAPLDPESGPPLLLDSYVRVDIEAGTIESALEIPRHALRENDRIWAVGPDNLLVIHDVEVLWRNEETLYISNVLAPGETVIISDLSSPLPGMALAPQLSNNTGS